MSMHLLRALQGSSSGRFRDFLDGLHREPRVAWYPSAGEDFRGLMYLSSQYAALNPALGVNSGGQEVPAPIASAWEPAPPDIFLFTDYFPWSTSGFLDSSMIHRDPNTSVKVGNIEELPSLKLPLDPQIVRLPEGSTATGRVLFLEVQIESRELGTMTWPVVYAFCENEAFCARQILAQDGRISHVIHVRYGGGMGGGGLASGSWLLHVLKRIGCEVLVSDDHLEPQSGDLAAASLYPELAAAGDVPQLHCLRRIPGAGWSDHGDVSWYQVK